MTIFAIRSWTGEIRNIPARYPLISERVAVRGFMQFGQDPLIVNQVVAVPKCLEIRVSGELPPFAGHPMGTRPIRKSPEPIKV